MIVARRSVAPHPRLGGEKTSAQAQAVHRCAQNSAGCDCIMPSPPCQGLCALFFANLLNPLTSPVTNSAAMRRHPFPPIEAIACVIQPGRNTPRHTFAPPHAAPHASRDSGVVSKATQATGLAPPAYTLLAGRRRLQWPRLKTPLKGVPAWAIAIRSTLARFPKASRPRMKRKRCIA
jgi:hypothetical protein